MPAEAGILGKRHHHFQPWMEKKVNMERENILIWCHPLREA